MRGSLVASPATLSPSSFPLMPTQLGTHCNVTLQCGRNLFPMEKIYMMIPMLSVGFVSLSVSRAAKKSVMMLALSVWTGTEAEGV